MQLQKFKNRLFEKLDLINEEETSQKVFLQRLIADAQAETELVKIELIIEALID